MGERCVHPPSVLRHMILQTVWTATSTLHSPLLASRLTSHHRYPKFGVPILWSVLNVVTAHNWYFSLWYMDFVRVVAPAPVKSKYCPLSGLTMPPGPTRSAVICGFCDGGVGVGGGGLSVAKMPNASAQAAIATSSTHQNIAMTKRISAIPPAIAQGCCHSQSLAAGVSRPGSPPR
jgi:hypothetical protein